MSDASSKPPTRRSSAKWAGVLLLLTAAATAVMVFARVAADVDEPTMAESLRAIPESRALFSLSAVARLVSGVTLIAAGWYLLRARSSPASWTTAPVAFLLCMSGVCTTVSGVAAIILAVGAIHGRAAGVAGVGVPRSMVHGKGRVLAGWAGARCWCPASMGNRGLTALLGGRVGGAGRWHAVHMVGRRDSRSPGRGHSVPCLAAGRGDGARQAQCGHDEVAGAALANLCLRTVRNKARRWIQPAAGLSSGEAIPFPRGSTPGCRARPSAGQPRT